jgi:hypothetical protein
MLDMLNGSWFVMQVELLAPVPTMVVLAIMFIG